MDWNLNSFWWPLCLAAVTGLSLFFYVYQWGHRAITDQANDRSLHDGQVLTSGGMFVLLPITLVALYFDPDFWPLYGLLLMMAVGLADDIWHWSAKPKLMAQLLVSLLLLWHLGFAETPVLACFLLLGLLWWLNLFNFMDGANGIAGLHALVAFAFYLTVLSPESEPLLYAMALWLIVALLVFLLFNLLLGRLFMGDAGSLPLAYAQAIMALVLIQAGQLSVPLVAIIHASFVADATFTLMVRMKNKERLSQAHNTHLYQRLVKSGWSHGLTAGMYALLTGLCCLLVWWLKDQVMALQWFVFSLVYSVLALVFIKTFKMGRALRTIRDSQSSLG